MTAPKMRFFTDQCVPESVPKALEDAGYEVIRLREKIATNTPDALVAAISEVNEAILVTMDGDFKAIASRTGIGRQRYRRLSLIRFEKCRESRTAERITAALSLIEHEWKISTSGKDRRIFITIGTDVIKTYR